MVVKISKTEFSSATPTSSVLPCRRMSVLYFIDVSILALKDYGV